jgi:short-subunit dehydrogenase
VVFCAAQYRPEHSWEVDPELASQTLEINLGSVYAGLAQVLPAMIARGSGGIALVASVAGYMGLPQASVYGPSKAALINLAEILYSDLHARGINVYLINPGFVDTGLTKKNSFTMPALQTPQQAASAILSGFSAGKFEIHFPKKFTRALKLVRLLPYRWRFFLFRRYLL